MSRPFVAFALQVVALASCTGCMDTRTASLGLEHQRTSRGESDAAHLPEKRDAGAGVVDASGKHAEGDAAGGDHEGDDEDQADDSQAGGEHDDQADDSHDDRLADAGEDLPQDSGRAPTIDAGPPAYVDAAVADASVSSRNDERDGAREDAKAPINPLCIAEPWHCQ